MLKNVFRIRIQDAEKMQKILSYFDTNKNVAKAFFRLGQEFLLRLSDIKFNIPLKLSNLVYLANAYQVRDEYIFGITPKSILKLVE